MLRRPLRRCCCKLQATSACAPGPRISPTRAPTEQQQVGSLVRTIVGDRHGGLVVLGCLLASFELLLDALQVAAGV